MKDPTVAHRPTVASPQLTRGHRPLRAPGPVRGRPPTNAFVNLSTLDRTLRILLGVTMLAAGWWMVSEAIWKITLEVYGWVPLATGGLGWDPAERPLSRGLRCQGSRGATRCASPARYTPLP
jgi:hypothetical protein